MKLAKLQSQLKASLLVLALAMGANSCLAQDALLLERTPLAASETNPARATEKASMTSYIMETFGKSKALALRIVNTVYREAASHNVSPLLALAIIEKESGFQPEAVNPSGATGLMQVIRRFHLDKLKNEPHPKALQHPETNIRVGVAVLKDYLTLSGGDVRRALTQYSGGARTYASQVQSVEGRLTKLVQEEQKRANRARRLYAPDSLLPEWCQPDEEPVAGEAR